MNRKHMGPSLRSLFDELGETEELDLLTRKKVMADEIRLLMERANITKSGLASAMKTSRTVVHRLLDPSDTGVTLDTMVRVANALGVEPADLLIRRPAEPKRKKSRAA